MRQTEEFLLESYNNYIENNWSLKQLHDFYQCDADKLSTKWKQNGWKVNDRRRRTAPDHNFFSVIDSEIKAYILGLFASDGHIEKRSYGSYTLKWDIQRRDQELLHLINEYVGNNTYNVFHLKDREISGISITSKQIGEDLSKLGYDNRKTHTCRSLPRIQDDMMKHFLRGYFDGDGCICVNKAKQGYNRFFSISSGHPEVLNEILPYLPIDNKSYIKTSDKLFGSKIVDCSVLSIHNRHDIENIFHYLYDNSNFFLKRKYEKFCLAKLTAKEIAALGSDPH